jgi:hypothetical protein
MPTIIAANASQIRLRSRTLIVVKTSADEASRIRFILRSPHLESPRNRLSLRRPSGRYLDVENKDKNKRKKTPTTRVSRTPCRVVNDDALLLFRVMILRQTISAELESPFGLLTLTFFKSRLSDTARRPAIVCNRRRLARY